MCSVGYESFRYKKDLQSKIRKILNRCPEGELPDLLGGKVLEFMLEVFRSHPNAAEKYGPGIQRVEVVARACGRTFWITRIDGTETDISYTKCVDHLWPSKGISKAYSLQKRNVTSALRHGINQQIYDFRKLQPAIFTCPECKRRTKNDSQSAHVDHHSEKKPSRSLTEEFLVGEKLKVNDVWNCPREEGGRQLVDSHLLRKWQEFHREHAVLRLLCAHCNRTAKRS